MKRWLSIGRAARITCANFEAEWFNGAQVEIVYGIDEIEVVNDGANKYNSCQVLLSRMSVNGM